MDKQDIADFKGALRGFIIGASLGSFIGLAKYSESNSQRF